LGFLPHHSYTLYICLQCTPRDCFFFIFQNQILLIDFLPLNIAF
jgi:hypothetical protein